MVTDGEPAGEVAGDPADTHARGGGPAILLMPQSSAVEVALLDLDGRIVCVNDAWTRFCVDNGGDPAQCGVGVSYLDVCDRAGDDTMATQVADAVRSALLGELPAPVAIDVPCHSTGELRWFDVLVSSRLDDDGTCMGATVTLSLARAVPRAPSPVPTLPPDPAPAPTGWPRGNGPRSSSATGWPTRSSPWPPAPCCWPMTTAGSSPRTPRRTPCSGPASAGSSATCSTGCSRRTGGTGVSDGAADGVGGWADPAYSGRVAIGARPDGSYIRLQVASAPVPLSYGTGVLVTASAVDRGPESAAVGALLVDLDAVLRRVFSAGLTLVGVRERLDRDGVPARVLTEAIADLDLAATELRHAARHD